jgi:hypothetical protein
MLDITNTLGFDLDVLYDAHPHGIAWHGMNAAWILSLMYCTVCTYLLLSCCTSSR